MEVDDFAALTSNSKKSYQKGSLMNVPNARFGKANKLSNSSQTMSIKKAKPSIDIEKARKLVSDNKGKVAQVPRFNVVQLKKMSLEQLIKLILQLQDENDRLRAELEKLRIKVQVGDRKGQHLAQLKATIR